MSLRLRMTANLCTAPNLYNTRCVTPYNTICVTPNLRCLSRLVPRLHGETDKSEGKTSTRRASVVWCQMGL